MQLEVEKESLKKMNLHSHARVERSRRDVSLAQAQICNIPVTDLRAVHLQFLTHLQDKIAYHRLRRGTYNNERASAYDAILQEFTQMLTDIEA